nr:MAG TPA: hypothetical protein [Bacteriophage sp.]
MGGFFVFGKNIRMKIVLEFRVRDFWTTWRR